jgi:hypothetical protein
MAKEEPKIIEQGDLFFFYRPKVGTKEVKDISDVQRFYMVTAPEGGKYRLFVVGQKQMPEIAEGRSSAGERNWALNILHQILRIYEKSFCLRSIPPRPEEYDE